MRPIHYITALILFLTTAAIICYKLFALELSFIPLKAQDIWNIEISYNAKNVSENFPNHPDKLYLPIPESTPSQRVMSNKFEHRKPKIVEIEGQLALEINLKKKKTEKISISSIIRLYGNREETSFPITKLTSDQEQRYINLNHLDPELREDIQILLNSIILEGDRPRTIVEKINFFMQDEVVLNPEINDLQEAVVMKTGSYLAQAKWVEAMLRMSKIPARLALGVKIMDQEAGSTTSFRYTRVIFNEVYINNRWVPLIPGTNKLGVVPVDFAIMGPVTDKSMEYFSNREYFSVFLDSEKFAMNDSSTYMQKLKSINSIWAELSLHRFPLSIQKIFFTVLLIPFGTVILSIARVLIGLNTFGIFTPILLTLFFLETNLTSGIALVFLAVFVGAGMRYVLDKLQLLAVPRLSILLTTVILIYLGFAMLGHRYDLFGKSSNTLNYFPIVIIAIFIERASVHFIEEGFKNTIKTLIGTVLVATGAYLIFNWQILKVILFNYPEFLLVAIGLNILIGGYTGFRLTELLRFRPLLKDM